MSFNLNGIFYFLSLVHNSNIKKSKKVDYIYIFQNCIVMQLHK